MTDHATPGLDLGNGAPPSLDDQTIARFTHFDTLAQHARVGLSPEMALQLDSHFIGCTTKRLAEIRAQHEAMVQAAATSLLRDDAFRNELAALPFEPGARLTITGDSITADSLSWARLLSAVLHRTHPDVSVLNIATSGITTGELLASSDLLARSRPDWVLQLIGTNDARRHGRATSVTAVSTNETRRNYSALSGMVQLDTRAHLVVITPPPMHQAMFDKFNPADAEIHWKEEELAGVAQLARECPARVTIDLHRQFTGTVADSFWTDDGVHPSFEGHQIILRHIVQALAEATRPPADRIPK